MNYSAFCATCIGASHIKKNIVCQDSSITVCTDRYAFAAVADGHGSKQYLRSEKGSQMCVNCAARCVEEFLDALENADEILDSERERQQLFGQLWRSIVCCWHEEAEKDFIENPFTDEELDSIPEKRQDYRKRYLSGDFIRAYGTTLLLCAVTDNFAFCMQIGDGTIVSLSCDGIFSKPVPVDSLCCGAATTSICQEDAVVSGRFCYFSKNNMPAAVFLGSDGIDDSYGFDDLLFGFYRGLALTIAQEGIDEAERQLKEYLPKMSQKGSEDDVSAACIISVEKLKEIEAKLAEDVENLKSNNKTG